jgi:hypothetical protein
MVVSEVSSATTSVGFGKLLLALRAMVLLDDKDLFEKALPLTF